MSKRKWPREDASHHTSVRGGGAGRPPPRGPGKSVRKGTLLLTDEQGPLPGSRVSRLAEKPGRMAGREVTQGTSGHLSRVERRVSSEVWSM